MARGRKTKEASGGGGRRGPEGCWKGPWLRLAESTWMAAGCAHGSAMSRACQHSLAAAPAPQPQPRVPHQELWSCPPPHLPLPQNRPRLPRTQTYPPNLSLSPATTANETQAREGEGENKQTWAGGPSGRGAGAGGARRGEPRAGLSPGARTSPALPRRPNEAQVVPWPGPTSRRHGQCKWMLVPCRGRGEGALQPQGRGRSGWPGAQHITLGRRSLGRSLGQQTPSRSEPSWQHEGSGPGRGPQGHRGPSPPCRQGPRQAGGCEGTGRSRACPRGGVEAEAQTRGSWQGWFV